MSRDGLADDERHTVETFVTDWMVTEGVPGAAVAVVDPSGPVYAEGFGARSLADGDPVTPDTLFGVGSCTKPVTATAVVRLAERGRIALDDPVDDYLPHLRDAPGEPVTVRELLSHTSGLPSDGVVAPIVTRPLDGGPVLPLASEADVRRHVRGAAARRVTDRETCRYSNTGYVLLALLVEAVTGEPFAASVEEHVLAPLSMERATFSQAAFEADADRMTPYVGGDAGPRRTSFPFDSLLHGPGGLLSSVAEMGDFLAALLGDAGPADDRPLPASRVAEMTTTVGTFASYLDGRDVGYGLGLMVEPFLDDELVSHGGTLPMSSAWVGYLTEADLGVVVACTTAPETHPMFVGPAVLALLRGREPTDVVPHYRLRSRLDAVAGEYGTYRGVGSATVERTGGTLRFEQTGALGSETRPLVPTRVTDDGLRCITVTRAGFAREARFELGAECVDLFIGRDRFEKTR